MSDMAVNMSCRSRTLTGLSSAAKILDRVITLALDRRMTTLWSVKGGPGNRLSPPRSCACLKTPRSPERYLGGRRRPSHAGMSNANGVEASSPAVCYDISGRGTALKPVRTQSDDSEARPLRRITVSKADARDPSDRAIHLCRDQ